MRSPEEIKDELCDIETLCGHCPYSGEPNGCNRQGGACKMYDVAQDAFDLIQQLENQIADAGNMVQHAHWIPCQGKSHIWYCSECGERISDNQVRRTYKPEKKPVHEVNRWCRGCGARMMEG